eukprot:gene42393-56326_t
MHVLQRCVKGSGSGRSGGGGGVPSSSSKGGRHSSHQWILSPSNAHKVIRQIKELIESSQTVPVSSVSSSTSSPSLSLSSPYGADNNNHNNNNVHNNNGFNGSYSHASASSNSPYQQSTQTQPSLDMSLGYGPPPLTGVSSTAAAMAPAYVRLWLALKEVQYRDAHVMVERAVSAVIGRVETHVMAEERDRERSRRGGESRRSGSDDLSTPSTSLRRTETDRSGSGSFDTGTAVDGRLDASLRGGTGSSAVFQFPALGVD